MEITSSQEGASFAFEENGNIPAELPDGPKRSQADSHVGTSARGGSGYVRVPVGITNTRLGILRGAARYGCGAWNHVLANVATG